MSGIYSIKNSQLHSSDHTAPSSMPPRQSSRSSSTKPQSTHLPAARQPSASQENYEICSGVLCLPDKELKEQYESAMQDSTGCGRSTFCDTLKRGPFFIGEKEYPEFMKKECADEVANYKSKVKCDDYVKSEVEAFFQSHSNTPIKPTPTHDSQLSANYLGASFLMIAGATTLTLYLVRNCLIARNQKSKEE